MGTQPLPKKGADLLPSKKFRPGLFWQTAGWIKMALGMQVGLSQGDFVSDGDPAAPLAKKGAEPTPQFLAHVYRDQTA